MNTKYLSINPAWHSQKKLGGLLFGLYVKIDYPIGIYDNTPGAEYLYYYQTTVSLGLLICTIHFNFKFNHSKEIPVSQINLSSYE